jgi:hypothetical protein
VTYSTPAGASSRVAVPTRPRGPSHPSELEPCRAGEPLPGFRPLFPSFATPHPAPPLWVLSTTCSVLRARKYKDRPRLCLIAASGFGTGPEQPSASIIRAGPHTVIALAHHALADPSGACPRQRAQAHAAALDGPPRWTRHELKVRLALILSLMRCRITRFWCEP